MARPLPPRQEGEVLVRARFSGISRGTESLVFRGEVPRSEYGPMRAPFQDGQFPAPVKYGYSSVGRVLDGPEGLRERTVFCLYPHQDLFCVPVEHVHPLPDEVPAERAVLAANAETALNAVWDGGAGPGDRVVVVGAGVVGLLIAWLCRRLPGSEVTVVDIDQGRAEVCRALGLTFTTEAPSDAAADLVFHASGQPAGLDSAQAAAGLEARIVEVSWYGEKTVPLALGRGFHSRRLTVASSQVGRVPPGRAPRWTPTRRLRTALGLLSDPALDALISGESAFDEIPKVMERVSRDGSGVLCHRIRYPHE